MKEVHLGEPTTFFDHFYLGCFQRECETSKDIVEHHRNMFDCKLSARVKEWLSCSGKFDSNIGTWSYDMEGHAKKCVERYCKLANTNQQLYKVPTPSFDDHQFKEEVLGSENCRKCAPKLP